MRSLIVDGIEGGAAPFEKKSEDDTWRSVKVQPAHATLALRVQAKTVAQHAPPSASAIPGDDALAQIMQQYVQTQQTELDTSRKKGTLSYDLKARVKEVGLSGLLDFPTEDAMTRFESALWRPMHKGASTWVRRKQGSPSEFERHGPVHLRSMSWWATVRLKRRSVVLLTCESSGASRIGSTISAMPTFKVMCLTGASRWSSRKSCTQSI